MKKFFTNNQKGISVISIILIIVGTFIVANVIYGAYMAYSIYTNRIPYSVATGGFGYDDEIDIDIHHWGKRHKYKPYSTQPRYPKNLSTRPQSKFGERFSSKQKNNSFFSRFRSKYGRSRTGSFRISGFLGGK